MIKEQVRKYILDEFLPGEDPEALGDDTELMTTGILDSLATLRLVAYLEEQFGFTAAPHELEPKNLNSVAAITRFVEAKRAQT